MVAKSYKNFPTVGEPFEKGGKMYINVRRPSGTVSTVRWYSLIEYKKLYPGEEVYDPYYKSQKELLGFSKYEYIWIFKGDTTPHKQWFKSNGYVYRRLWGWGGPEPAEPIPEGIQPVKLVWNAVGNGEKLKPDEAVIAVVKSLLGQLPKEL